MTYEMKPVGRIESELADIDAAPRQPDEGAPEAWLVFAADNAAALQSLEVGEDIFVLTWLHEARRDVLTVHPRGDATRAEAGVFSTRSPHRPNPIGLHRVRITAVDGLRIRVDRMEAVNGTPILDVKPVLNPRIDER